MKSCLFPLYENERGITKLNYNPEKAGQKIPVKEPFLSMGSAFGHLGLHVFVCEEFLERLEMVVCALYDF